MNALTRGLAGLIAEGEEGAALFATWAPQVLKEGREPSFAVGRPDAEAITYEDNGNTIVYPLPKTCPKLYAAMNETGGVTVMLADEY